MYSDPQSVTVNAVAKSMPRQPSVKYNIGQFKTDDGLFSFQIRQNATQRRNRREVVLTQQKIAADPLTAVNSEISGSVQIVVDMPKTGFSNVEIGYLTSAIIAWFTAGNRDALLGGQI
jgi:hypothetical protein